MTEEFDAPAPFELPEDIDTPDQSVLETPTESTEELTNEISVEEPTTETPVEPEVETPVVETAEVEEEKPGGIASMLDDAINAPPQNALTDAMTLIDQAALGAGDFISDAAGVAGRQLGISWLDQYDEWWDKHNPKSDDPLHTFIRDASAIILPSLMTRKLLIGGATTALKGRHIPSAYRTLGNIAAQAGIDVSIAGITSQSFEQDNMAGAIYKLTGVKLPGATTDGMNQDLRKKLHMYEAGAFSFAVDMILGLHGFIKAVGRYNMNQKAINHLDKTIEDLRAIVSADGSDPVTDLVQGTAGRREALINEEGAARLANKVDDSYDPFINNAASKEDLALPPDEVFPPDPVGAKGDYYAIQNNEGTVNGIARPIASKEVLDQLGGELTERGRTLAEFYNNDLTADADLIINNKSIPAEDLNKAVDNLVDNVLDPDITLKQFEDTINQGKTLTFQGRKFLSEDKWVEASYAWKRLHDNLFNSNNLKASTVISQQAADSVVATSRAINLLEDIASDSRQWEIVGKKMKLLVGEVTVNKDVVARSQELKRLVEGRDFHKLAEWLNLQSSIFEDGIRVSRNKADRVIDEITLIAKENPLYMRPLAEAYDASNGDINTLYKLHKWAEANISLIKKGIIDTNPELPSMFVQGLKAIRYNSILNGLAPARALVGNSTMMVIKPISVFAGAMATGDVGTFKRAMYTYGGITENFKRAFKLMGDDWRLTNSNPEIAVKRGRQDISMTDTARFEAAQTMAEAWRQDGKDGKVAMWNMVSHLTSWNNWKWNRWGINSLYTLDGLPRAFNAAGSARASAYDALLEATNGAFSAKQFRDLQRNLYNESFDQTGKLTNKAAAFASNEMTLNLDYKSIERFEHFLGHVPPAKALFMFPRTGANAFELSWSFNPISNIVPLQTRAQRVFTALEPWQRAEVMAEHGLENTDEAFNMLKSEYIGRQLMGGSVIMGAGMWAIEGNITGNGPQDADERKRMMNMGWRPKSIKNPFNGKWYSYKGLEPIESILSLTSDFIYQARRFDQSIAEDWFRKLTSAITLNVTNSTLTQGLEPLVSLFSGDEGAWNRFFAQVANTSLPWAGTRTILNNAIHPQIMDVERDFKTQLQHYNKFAFRGNDYLADMVDIYTGEPINISEECNFWANAVLPTFKCNGTMEPWRQWLLSTGYDKLQHFTRDPVTKEEMTPHARQWINNWVGKHTGLKAAVVDIMNMSDDKWQTELRKYKKSLGLTGQQDDAPIKKIILYRLLDEAHGIRIEAGIHAYYRFIADNDPNKLIYQSIKKTIKGQLIQGDTQGVEDSLKELQQYK